MWWITEVENPVTGTRETKGERLIGALGVMKGPEAAVKANFPGQDRLTILLLGLDHVPSTPGDPGVIRRCDSVLVATTDFKTRQIRLLSIPRDGWIEHYQDGRSFGYDKLAHTYSLGQQYGLRNGGDATLGGIARSMESVENLLGENIDHYIVIQFDGMVELVNTICPDGLLVDVEKNMKYTDRAGDLYIDLKAGPQRLKGEELLGYARFRKDSTGDIGRMGRQQKVLRLLLAELTNPENLSRIPAATEILRRNVETSLSPGQLLALGQYMKLYSADAVRSMTLQSWYNLEQGKEMDIPGLSVDAAINGGYHVQGIFEKDIKEGVEFLNSLNPPPPPDNGAGEQTLPDATDESSSPT